MSDVALGLFEFISILESAGTFSISRRLTAS